MPVNKSQVTKIVQLNLDGLSEDAKTEAKVRAGEILVEEINEYLDGSNSPVKYEKALKKKVDGTPSQLYLDGDMRSNITYAPTDDGVEVGIFPDAPEKEILKAFNHNVGDTLPPRPFIPMPSGEFKVAIMNKVNAAVREVKQVFKEEEKENVFLQESSKRSKKESNRKTVGDILKALDTLEFENF